MHQPTEKDRAKVERLAGHGVAELEIASVMGISLPTLRKWYTAELLGGPIHANSMVAQALFEKAMGTGQGAVTACIFWLKCRAKWVEPKPWDEVPGRKEQLQQAAATAGGANTEWATDLEVNQVN